MMFSARLLTILPAMPRSDALEWRTACLWLPAKAAVALAAVAAVPTPAGVVAAVPYPTVAVPQLRASATAQAYNRSPAVVTQQLTTSLPVGVPQPHFPREAVLNALPGKLPHSCSALNPAWCDRKGLVPPPLQEPVARSAPVAPRCEGARCTHVAAWRRLRRRKGFVFYGCRECGVQWRISSSRYFSGKREGPPPRHNAAVGRHIISSSNTITAPRQAETNGLNGLAAGNYDGERAVLTVDVGVGSDTVDTVDLVALVEAWLQGTTLDEDFATAVCENPY